MKLFIFLLIIPLISELKSDARLMLDTYSGLRQRIGKGKVVEATEDEAFEMVEMAEGAAVEGTEVAEAALVLAPFAPEIIIFGGLLALGGLLYEELTHNLNHAKSKSKSTTEQEKPREL